jgi:MOSC domain-containing protein YiiM
MSKVVGNVIALFISKRGEEQRVHMERAELDGDGIIEDKFYGKDINRSVLLTTTQSYELALKNGIEISYGSLGENILIDFNPYDLPIGRQIKIGNVLVEVTQNCTICNHLSKIDKSLPKLLEHDRGIFVRVIEKGTVTKGDMVTLL